MRRYAPIAKSHGTVISPELRKAVMDRDRGCVARGLFPGDCIWSVELDHVRASHGIGMKSETSERNLVVLCGAHHLWKTTHGREARPILMAYLTAKYPSLRA